MQRWNAGIGLLSWRSCTWRVKDFPSNKVAKATSINKECTLGWADKASGNMAFTRTRKFPVCRRKKMRTKRRTTNPLNTDSLFRTQQNVNKSGYIRQLTVIVFFFRSQNVVSSSIPHDFSSATDEAIKIIVWTEETAMYKAHHQKESCLSLRSHFRSPQLQCLH
jgi:hypothetical protein